jgi:hypothetical protein
MSKYFIIFIESGREVDKNIEMISIFTGSSEFAGCT